MTNAEKLEIVRTALNVIRGVDVLLEVVDRVGFDDSDLDAEDLQLFRGRRRAAAERTRHLTPVPSPGGVAGE